MNEAPDPTLLPPGIAVRPLATSDARAVFEVMARQELTDTGEVEIEEADIVGDWQRPSFDVAGQTIGVFDGDALVGYAEWSRHDRGDAAVDPTSRGQGIGTYLARWMQWRAREGGAEEVGMPVPEGSAGDRLLAALGYRVRWTSWVLHLPGGREIVPQPLPAGYRLGLAESDRDRRAAHEVLEDAFLEWSRRPREEFDDFTATVLQRPGFEPWQLRVALDAEDRIVGVSSLSASGETTYIARLAVRADQRGLGLGRVLLADSFAAGRAHGHPRAELSTDSRTGALGLYEHVGMEVTSIWVNRAIRLDRGTVTRKPAPST